jgi:hypothetical protein
MAREVTAAGYGGKLSVVVSQGKADPSIYRAQLIVTAAYSAQVLDVRHSLSAHSSSTNPDRRVSTWVSRITG